MKWIYIFASTALFILSDSLAANWAKNGSKLSLWILLILAPIGYIFFGLLNKSETLASSSGLVNMGLLSGTVLVGIFLFRDSLTFEQIIGLSLAFLAMYYLA